MNVTSILYFLIRGGPLEIPGGVGGGGVGRVAIPPKNSCKTNKMIYIVTKCLGEKVIDRPTQT